MGRLGKGREREMTRGMLKKLWRSPGVLRDADICSLGHCVSPDLGPKQQLCPAATVAPPGGDGTHSGSHPFGPSAGSFHGGGPKISNTTQRGRLREAVNTPTPPLSLLPGACGVAPLRPLKSSQMNTGEQIPCLTAPHSGRGR